MNDEAITTILRHVDEYFLEPEQDLPRNEFIRRSYSRWAAYEIVELLLDRPFTPAWQVIDEFIIKMCYFSHLMKDDDGRFELAIDIAEDFQALLT